MWKIKLHAYPTWIGTEIALRPHTEYLLTSTCGNANYGNKSGPDWQNAPASKYQEAPIRSEYYQRPLNYAKTTAYPYVVDTSGGLDVFGVNVGYPVFTIAGFFYRQQASNSFSSGVKWSSSTGAPPYKWGEGIIKIFLWTQNGLNFGYAKTNDIYQVGILPSGSGSLDIWYHMAVSYDWTKLKQYINGVLHSEAAWPSGIPIASTNPVYASCVMQP